MTRVLRQRALVGMNELLQSKQSALPRRAPRSRRRCKRAGAQRGAASHQISKVKAQQAAAAAAAAKASAQAAADTALPTPTGPALSAGSGWAIPWAIVDCESGRPELPSQQRRRLGLLPDHPQHLAGVRGHRPGRVSDVEGRAERGRQADLGRSRPGRVGLRQHRRHHVIAGYRRPLLSTTVQTPTKPGIHDPAPRCCCSWARCCCSRWRCASATSRRPRFTRSTTPAPTTGSERMIAQLGDYNRQRIRLRRRWHHGPTAYFPPAYPYFVAPRRLVDGHAGHASAWLGIRLGGAVLGTIAVGLLGLVALEAFGGAARAGRAGARRRLPGVHRVGRRRSSPRTCSSCSMLASVWTALRRPAAAHPGRLAWIAATGVLAGLATLSHENAAVFVIPLAVAAAAAAGHTRRRRRLGALTLLAATAAMIAPWTIRNAVELHHFIPVADETGITLRGTYNARLGELRTAPLQVALLLVDPAGRRRQATRLRRAGGAALWPARVTARWATSAATRPRRWPSRGRTCGGCSSCAAATPGTSRRTRSGCTNRTPRSA